MVESKKTKQRPTDHGSSMTPEEQIARALRAKRRFKAIVTFVMQNLYWLSDIEEEELSDDVQKNVILLTRKKSAKALTLQDKFILNKPPQERSPLEKLHLDRVIGGLSCFRRYPGHVKSQLAGVTCFVYFGPGRTVIRQGHESVALYFIITGNVSILQETFDPVLNENVVMNLGTNGPGSKFGEVSLLHNIPRTATIVTNTHCEFLCLKKLDFDAVLKDTVQQQWTDITNAMRLFSYFENWDEISMRECCILSKMNSYAADDIILGDGVGHQECVYFILEGNCQVIENLLVIPYIKNGIKHYKLYQPSPVNSASVTSKDNTKKSNEEFQTISHKKCSQASNKYEIRASQTTSMSSVTRMSIRRSINTELRPSIDSLLTHENISDAQSQRRPTTETKSSKLSSKSLPPDVETYFMQVCLFNPKACFGIGENMFHRRVLATVNTKCLLIPRYWLMQKGNIWPTVQHYLINHIPSTTEVFKEFIKQRKWMEYRKKLFNDLIKRKLPNINSILNVPYFYRIHSQDFE